MIWQWLKKKIWWFLSIAGIVAVAFAVSSPVPGASIPIVYFQGEKLAFAHTDDNTNEELIIRTMQEFFGGWDIVPVIFSVTNTMATDENVTIRFLYEGNEATMQVNELLFNQSYTIPVADYGKKDFTCLTTWVATTTNNDVNEYECSANQTTQICDVVSLNTCTNNNAYLGSHDEIRHQDVYAQKTLADSTNLVSEKLISTKFSPEKQLMHTIPAGMTKYFKADVQINHGASPFEGKQSEFYIEAFGSNGSYGILK